MVEKRPRTPAVATSNATRCDWVTETKWSRKRCERTAVVEADGMKLCSQHDPARRATKVAKHRVWVAKQKEKTT